MPAASSGKEAALIAQATSAGRASCRSRLLRIGRTDVRMVAESASIAHMICPLCSVNRSCFSFPCYFIHVRIAITLILIRSCHCLSFFRPAGSQRHHHFLLCRERGNIQGYSCYNSDTVSDRGVHCNFSLDYLFPGSSGKVFAASRRKNGYQKILGFNPQAQQ